MDKILNLIPPEPLNRGAALNTLFRFN